MNSVSNTSLCRQMFEKNSSLSTDKSRIYFIRGRLKSGWALTCWAQCRLSSLHALQYWDSLNINTFYLGWNSVQHNQSTEEFRMIHQRTENFLNVFSLMSCFTLFLHYNQKNYIQYLCIKSWGVNIFEFEEGKLYLICLPGNMQVSSVASEGLY